MADHTQIEWTDATWNVVTGCSVVSPGCTNCYAMRLAGTRLKDHPSRIGLTVDSKAGPVWNGQVRFNAEWLTQPLRWTKPRKIFVAAHGDLFHEGVTDDQLDQIFAVMALRSQHVFQVLTKRPKRARDYLLALTPDQLGRALRRFHLAGEKATRADRFITLPLPNVWLGVSAEDQARADERIPFLLATPAAVHWVSAEPLLGGTDLTRIGQHWHLGKEAALDGLRGVRLTGKPSLEDGAFTEAWAARIDWVVVGGESGQGSRPMHPDWARDLRDQCGEAGVPFLFKQWGDWTPGENAQSTVGRTVQTADWFNDRWDYETLTPASTEGMHIDDEPTVYRAGKKAAGRLLDGRRHDGYPSAPGDG